MVVGAEQPARLVHLGPGPRLHDVLQQLGVQLDGADRVAHLVGDLEAQPAHRGHALGLEQLGLRCLQPAHRAGELGVEPPHLGAGAPLALGHDAHGHARQPHEHGHQSQQRSSQSLQGSRQQNARLRQALEELSRATEDMRRAASGQQSEADARRDNVLRALDRGNGTQRWQQPIPGRTVGGPIQTGSLVVVATLSPQLHAYRRTDGKPAGSSEPPAGGSCFLGQPSNPRSMPRPEHRPEGPSRPGCAHPPSRRRAQGVDR